MTDQRHSSFPRALLAVAVLLSAVACTIPPQGPASRYSGSENPRSSQKVEGNSAIASNLEIKPALTTRRNGLLTVQFEVVNKSTWGQAFQWTIDWYDRQGLLVPNATRHWEPMRLASNASQTISIVAPNVTAESWCFQVGDRDEVQ